MKRFEIILLFLLMMLAVNVVQAQTYGLQISNKKGRTTIPFKTFNNLIIIQVSINHSDSMNFIVDTGVRNTILIEKTIADEMGLEYSRTIEILGAASDQIIIGHIVNKVLFEAVGLAGNIHSLLVIEDDFIKLENYFGRKIHGIIGYDLFRSFIVKINYDRKEIKLYRPENFKAPRFYTKINFEQKNSKPYIDVLLTIDDSTKIKSHLMIDLGASHSSLLELKNRNKIKLPEKYITSSPGRGLGGKIEGYKARIKRIDIDKFKFKNVIVSFAEPNTLRDSVFRLTRDGTLGGEIMSRFHVIFNYFDNSIYLKKNKNYRIPFEYNLCGINLMIVEMGFNAYLVDEIIEGSPADHAGIKVGDYLKEINHIPTHKMSYDEITGIFLSRPKRRLHLLLNRNGKDIIIKLRLKRQI
ncbi:MAG: aspartyl protease family protein [Bacteroidota bacterium]|nr:aspartyl protease family protein [Bacteroidota bacterium]